MNRPRLGFLFTFFAMVVPSMLLAAETVRWSPLDAYLGRVAAPPTHAPIGLRVLDGQGRVLTQADYEYKDGSLVREVFRNADGQTEGETRYLYNAGLMQEARTMNAEGKLVSRMQTRYEGDRLLGMEVYDGAGNLQMKQEYVYQEGRITGGVERAGGSEDEFQIQYANNRPAAFLLRNAENGVVQTIRYQYDHSGRLAARIREAFGSVSRCVYSYDPRGRLLSYAYADRLADGSWSASKKLELRYSEN